MWTAPLTLILLAACDPLAGSAPAVDTGPAEQGTAGTTSGATGEDDGGFELPESAEAPGVSYHQLVEPPRYDTTRAEEDTAAAEERVVGSDVYGEVICSEPLPGEPPGQSDGLVCTEQSMNGCTEEGRRFDDYVSCEPLYDIRGYYPVPVEVEIDPEDPRHDDPWWAEESEWARGQIEACSCICCHSDVSTPEGAAEFFVEAEPYWIDSASDWGVAFFAGYVQDNFGSLPPGENNGFDRSQNGLPTTEIERMRAFIMAEVDRRGIVAEDYEGESAGAGPGGGGGGSGGGPPDGFPDGG